MPTISQLSRETEIRSAVSRDQLALVYQPIVDISNLRVVGFEALTRWKHPRFGLVMPGEFIPLAVETGAIGQIEEWILFGACQQARVWQEIFGDGLKISINLSAPEFSRPDFISHLGTVLEKTGADPASLELEITETTLMDNEEITQINLHSLRELGIDVAIDDFGVGYSSLNYLTRFEIDRIKVDKSFVDEITNSKSFLVLQAVIDLGRNLGLNITAEGVEGEQQLQRLRLAKCQNGQGFLFHKPLESLQVTELLESGAHLKPEPIRLLRAV